MNIFRTSAYQFDNPDNLPFSRIEYSKMKFGCRTTADFCGFKLANAFIEFLKENSIEKQIVVSASPYQEMPKSSHHLFVPFVKYVNRYLFKNGLNRILTTSIARNHVYNIEYSSLTQSDREKNLGKGPMLFNEKLLKGNHYVLIDDLRMTGTVEKNIIKKIQEQNIQDICDFHFLYYVENIKPETVDATFENRLNFSAISSIDDFINILKDGADWNMRSLKYILELPAKEIIYFFDTVSTFNPKIIENFYDMIISSNVYSVKSYKKPIDLFFNHYELDGVNQSILQY